MGEETTLAGIRRLVEESQSSSSRAQSLADCAAELLSYVATAAGVNTLVVWMALGQAGRAIENTGTILVISCPHALGLAIPLVIAISTALSARNVVLLFRLIANVDFRRTSLSSVGSRDDQDRSRR